MMKRVLSIALVLLMLFAMMPTTALANNLESTIQFSDLQQTHWAYSEIMYLAQRQIINGFPDGTYRPNEPITLEQFATLVVGVLGADATHGYEIFEDVPINRWSNANITTAVIRGIIVPNEHGNVLGADSAITREISALWMVRALGIAVTDTQTTFNDNHDITHRSEIATAVEIGLIQGMPNNLFAPSGSTTRAQAAVLVVRMSNILNEISIQHDFEEVFHYVYRSDVTVISNAPEYTLEEIESTFIITFPTSDIQIQGLTIGEMFVLEPTEANPMGLAGRVISVTNEGSNTVVVASIPESLEEIFSEFELAVDIDLLSDISTGIWLAEELQGVDGIEIIRNPTDFMELRLTDFHFEGIRITGDIRMYTPRVQVTTGFLNLPNSLTLSTTVEKSMTASIGGGFDRVVPLFVIGAMPFPGVFVEMPIGLRVTADGRLGYLTAMYSADVDLGLSRLLPPIPFLRVEDESSLDLNVDYGVLRGRASLAINIQARGRILGIGAIGVQADVGGGVEFGGLLLNRCPVNVCVIAGLFPLLRVSTLGERLSYYIIAPTPRLFVYIAYGRLHTRCPHANMQQQQPVQTPMQTATTGLSFGYNGLHGFDPNIRDWLVNNFPRLRLSILQPNGERQSFDLGIDEKSGTFFTNDFPVGTHNVRIYFPSPHGNWEAVSVGVLDYDGNVVNTRYITLSGAIVQSTGTYFIWQGDITIEESRMLPIVIIRIAQR